ncbi:DNA phosphorothioation system sulfurtransferase DndC [Pseudoxanthomonas sp.]|uniref:DNA phosphorothioation system sulfurtransferase DndC n=1 Tax=Pseudoxanthomonas sp. TaxID=1871049 RepID=UPI002E1687D3|nr:DNA phosphorothioation system sulfurtransferase DndC [Pseudoxanthomonas sp.]
MSIARPRPKMDPALGEKIKLIQQDIRDEYLADHQHPWIIGFSGGKDSTLVAHLVFDVLMSLAPHERTREVHIVSNDTLVESPLVITHIAAVQSEIDHAASAWRMPIRVVTTRPDADATFWVNMVGRGYPPPNRSFRWCTDRMKIQPTSRYIREQAAAAGEVILLLGVRRSESSTRAATVARYDNGERLNRHNDLLNCMVFRPIVELSTDEVWEFLAFNPPPWGGTHGALIKLYMDAGAAECPTVLSQDDAPACGTSSSRFGCWTCTVVEKDKSLMGFVEAGYGEFTPLVEFRDWLASIRDDPQRRMARRRNGRLTVTNDGVFIPGPFTLETRQEILDRVLDLEHQMKCKLIEEGEVTRIREIWAEDASMFATWSVDGDRAIAGLK